jgi:hypothetical protein
MSQKFRSPKQKAYVPYGKSLGSPKQKVWAPLSLSAPTIAADTRRGRQRRSRARHHLDIAQLSRVPHFAWPRLNRKQLA